AVRLRVLATIAAELDRTDGGSAHIRILPPDRPVLATVVVNHPESGSRRIELDAAANPLAHP
ncbi:MAG: hypothetical protein J2P18_19235, partial [Nocardia sp.]|nr:hypothetical protein [Nocardia sp.]